MLEPFRHDAPLVYRRGAWRFLPKAIVFGVFAVTNNDFYSGLKPMPQAADSGEVAVRARRRLSVPGASTTSSSSAKVPADSIVTGWELTGTISTAARTRWRSTSAF
jgi:hypothetical protein